MRTAMALSITVLHHHVSRAIGVEVFRPAGDLLLARALIDIHSHPTLSPADAAARSSASCRAWAPTPSPRCSRATLS
ncbi:MAG: hypothetical protein ACR2G2_13395 [Pseudonocardia sp.]